MGSVDPMGLDVRSRILKGFLGLVFARGASEVVNSFDVSSKGLGLADTAFFECESCFASGFASLAASAFMVVVMEGFPVGGGTGGGGCVFVAVVVVVVVALDGSIFVVAAAVVVAAAPSGPTFTA